jgi:hypothetical protein
MSNSSGKYAVPEEILKFKPRGTMVKRIHGGFYVYAMENVKNPETGKWQTKSKGILGKITAEDGYIPNTDMGYTVLEYGAYHLAEECASEIKEQFQQAFGKGDNAKRIWVLALIYSVNGFRPISQISLLYRKSSLAVSYPALKMGETAVSNILESLGRRDTESRKFQSILLQSVKEMAIDGHVIPRYSKKDGMTEYGYKYKSLGSEQVNLLTAYDVKKNRPVAMKMFDGSKNDKASVKELIPDVLIEGCLYLMDRGFNSPELKKMIADKKATYIMPLSSNMDSYQAALKRGKGRLKTFIYRRREGIHVIKSVVEYRVSAEENGAKTIYFRNLHEAEGEKANYLECIEKKVPGYSEAKLETVEKTLGVIILETTHNGTPEEIYNYYKDRWSIEVYYDYLKHQMDFNALGVQDWAKLQGLAFMMLLATLINGSIQERLRQSSLSGVYMPEVLLTASSIKAMKRNDLWTIENASKGERDLFKALSVQVGAELKQASFGLPT